MQKTLTAMPLIKLVRISSAAQMSRTQKKDLHLLLSRILSKSTKTSEERNQMARIRARLGSQRDRDHMSNTDCAKIASTEPRPLSTRPQRVPPSRKAPISLTIRRMLHLLHGNHLNITPT